MSRYVVQWTFECDADDELEAGALAFREMVALSCNPTKGQNAIRVSDYVDPSKTTYTKLDDALLDVSPLFLSQILGFRQFIWINQDPPRASKR